MGCLILVKLPHLFNTPNLQLSLGIFSPLQPVISHQEYNQPTVASNSVVNINSAVNSPDIENIQKELQERLISTDWEELLSSQGLIGIILNKT
jgi:hypothetical protein